MYNYGTKTQTAARGKAKNHLKPIQIPNVMMHRLFNTEMAYLLLFFKISSSDTYTHGDDIFHRCWLIAVVCLFCYTYTPI